MTQSDHETLEEAIKEKDRRIAKLEDLFRAVKGELSAVNWREAREKAIEDLFRDFANDRPIPSAADAALLAKANAMLSETCEHLRATVKNAYYEGFCQARSTVDIGSELDESWERSSAKRDLAGIMGEEPK